MLFTALSLPLRGGELFEQSENNSEGFLALFSEPATGVYVLRYKILVNYLF